MDDTEKALLKKIAENLNQQTVINAYSDYLQEIGNPGWLIVKAYNPKVWSLPCPINSWSDYGKWRRVWRLPWLVGRVEIDYSSNWRTRLKKILNLYAEGKTQS